MNKLQINVKSLLGLGPTTKEITRKLIKAFKI